MKKTLNEKEFNLKYGDNQQMKFKTTPFVTNMVKHVIGSTKSSNLIPQNFYFNYYKKIFPEFKEKMEKNSNFIIEYFFYLIFFFFFNNFFFFLKYDWKTSTKNTFKKRKFKH
jgi:hypothetical protein